MLYAHLPKRQRRNQVAATLRDSEEGKVDLTGLLTACRGEQLVGALLVLQQPGRSAMLWPPALYQSADAGRVADALFAEADRRLARRGVRLLQTLLDPQDQEGRRCLKRNGYVHLAELLYLDCRLSRRPTTGATKLTFTCYTPEQQGFFETVVERTYEGSLDAPRLNGVRAMGDVLAGHRAVGNFDPARWLLAYEGQQPVGCLLLADHSEMDAWEVVYLGVLCASRGRGLGRELTREAIRRAQQGGVRRLLLAVDQNNHPACRIYSELGFLPWDRRSAFVRILRSKPRPAN